SCGRRRRSGHSLHAEDPGQFVRRRHVELVVAAILRRLVDAPAHERRRVAEALSLQVVVLDLADALGPERLPTEVLAAAPAALRARHPLRVADDRAAPVAPWVRG